MMHPNTELRFVNSAIGYGVFATAFIPRGTIVYVVDALDLEIDANDPRAHDPRYKNLIKRYSSRGAEGNYSLSWDIAKYVNHCCQCNSISTGYNFEIAIKDIAAGEQITDDYGLFNLEEEICLICEREDCRGRVGPGDFDRYAERWDELIKDTLKSVTTVTQPLMEYLDNGTYTSLMNYLNTGENYTSVCALRYSHRSNNLEIV
jgi:hypothetical protein